MSDKKQYNMDGIYYRVKREGKWKDICFSDMTPEEIDEVIGDQPASYWRRVADHLAHNLRQLAALLEQEGIEIGFGVEDDE